MKQIADRLFVGSQADFEALDQFHTEWPIVFCAKFPWHQKLLGYKGPACPPNDPEYLFARRDKRLYLNLIDAPDAKYFHKVAIDAAIAFIEEQIATLKETDAENVLCVCNQGQSRSAGIGLLYMAPSLPEDFEAAETEYRKAYPSYNPGDGMRGFARIHWDAYRNRKGTPEPTTVPETDPALDKAQQIWRAFAETFATDPTKAKDNLIASICSALRASENPDVRTQERGTDGRGHPADATPTG